MVHDSKMLSLNSDFIVRESYKVPIISISYIPASALVIPLQLSFPVAYVNKKIDRVGELV